MYGVKPDIPGFHYYDKRARRELHFPEAGAADFVETSVAAGRRGILEGGSCYGCVFTGGAENSLLTFARLMKPTRAGLPLLRLGLSVVLLGWVIAKCLWLTAVELARFVVRVIAHPDSASPDGLRWLGLKIVFSIWVRELFTLSVSADLYRGIAAVYVNFLDYDVFAHSFGPTHRSALRALRHIDNAIGQLARIIERLPEHQYDLYILSDHGQTTTRSFAQVSGVRSLEQVTRDILSAQDGRTDPPRRVHLGVARQIVGYRRPDSRGILQRFFNHVERQRPVEISRDSAGEIVRIITAGPNAFVYFLDDAEPLAREAVLAPASPRRRPSPSTPASVSSSRDRRGAPCTGGGARRYPWTTMARTAPSRSGRTGSSCSPDFAISWPCGARVTSWSTGSGPREATSRSSRSAALTPGRQSTRCTRSSSTRRR
jgi:hypothetical protein